MQKIPLLTKPVSISGRILRKFYSQLAENEYIQKSGAMFAREHEHKQLRIMIKI